MQARDTVLLPAFLLGCIQRGGEVAGAVAKQQLVQPRVLESHPFGGQLHGLEFTQPLQRAPVFVADESAVKVFVHIARAGGFRA